MILKTNKSILFFIISFLLMFIWSSSELYMKNIIDLDGDATWYFESAINKMYDENFYPIYPLFITYVGIDNPYLTRIAQFVLLLILTLFIFNNIENRNWTESSIVLFKVFFVTNFGLYLLIIQLVRDWMLFSLVAISLILFTNSKNNAFKFSMSLFALLLLLPLSQTLPFILITAYIITFVQFDIFKKRSAFKIILACVLLFTFYILFKENMSSLLERSLDVVSGDKVLIDESAKSNFILGFFNFLFGPGLIRPLFPSKYYIVYTYYFSFLTWVACLSWMVQFSISTSIFFQNSKKLNFSKNFFIFFYTFFIYVSIYVAAFGGPGGLRKRMIAYFIFTLCVCELFSKTEILPFNKKSIINTFLVLITLIFVTSIFSL